MPSNRRVRLTAEARDDLRNLLQYSREAWGQPLRDPYRAAIQQRFSELADHPWLGRPRDDLFSGCRGLPFRQHMAYYIVTEFDIIIVRILDERRGTLGMIELPRRH